MADAHKYQAHEVLNRVLNSGENALQVDIISGAEYAEDSAHTDADTGNFILGVRNDTLAALGGTDGDYVPFQMNSSGALFVEVSSASSPAGHGAVAQFTTNIGTSATILDAHACKHADIMGKVANAGIVYVGGSSVAATTGIALYPGDVYSVDVTNTNLLYGIAVNANDDLQVVYYN